MGRDASTYTLPSSTTTIYSRAFSGCTNLTSVTISEGVTHIDANMFSGCENLTDVTLPASLENLPRSESSGAGVVGVFSGCDKLTTAGPSDDGNVYNITFGWTDRIPDGAFAGCSNLGNVNIPDTVMYIYGKAFYQCTNLVDVRIPNSVIEIGAEAFAYCGLNRLSSGVRNTDCRVHPPSHRVH